MKISHFKKLLGVFPESREGLLEEKYGLVLLHTSNSRILLSRPFEDNKAINGEVQYAAKRIEFIDKKLAEIAKKGVK